VLQAQVPLRLPCVNFTHVAAYRRGNKADSLASLALCG